MSSDQPQALPYIVSPSYRFDGDDGDWSTFEIEVGTPPQSFRVLPNLVGEEIWLPAPEGCAGPLSDTPNCGDLRGVNDFQGEPSRGYSSNESSTWNYTGHISVLDTQQNLFDGDAGAYALETVALGTASPSSSDSLSGQMIAGISTVDFWLGTLGLGTYTSAAGTPSLLTAMRNQNLSTSLSFGYTAGQSYASPQVPGSLVLGGYDQARIQSSDMVSMPINSTARPQELQLTLNQIYAQQGTLDGQTSNMLPNPINVNIDSGTSWLWLPESVCDQFAQNYGLTYDNRTEMYLVNSTTHLQLLGNPPVVLFRVGGDDQGYANIILHYNAFDLQVGIPLYPNDTNYFPIRRAANESQYTLGRTFLQESYIIVDWERSNFTIGQAVPRNNTPSIVPILSPSVSKASTSSAQPTQTPTTAPSSGKKFPTGAIAGIVIVIIAIAAIAAGAYLCIRRRRKRRQPEDHEKHENVEPAAPEYDAGIVENYPPEKTDPKYDLPEDSAKGGDYKRPEFHERKHSELSDTQVYELDHPQDGTNRQLMSSPVHDRELMSTPIMELEGSPYIGSELDVGYGRTDDPTPPETGAASRVSMSPMTPRLIDETMRSPRRFTLEDAPYEDEPEDVRDRVVSGVVSEMSDLRSDTKSPDFSDFDGSEMSPSEATLQNPPPLLPDIEKPNVEEEQSKPKESEARHEAVDETKPEHDLLSPTSPE